MNKHLIVFALLSMLFGFSVSGQDNNTYNFNRAVEEYENGNYQSAMQLFYQELQRNDEDPGSWFYMAAIFNHIDQLGRALDAINNCIKFTPNKKKEMLASAYYLRSSLHNQLGDTVAELADLDAAVRLQSKDRVYWRYRGVYFYHHQDYDRSDADFGQMLKINPHDAYAMIALSRNATQRKQYAQAVQWCSQAKEADDDMSIAALMFRADAHMGLKDYERAADDLVQALSEGGAESLNSRLTELADSSFTPLFDRLSAKVTAEPENENWIYAAGLVAVATNHYAEAIPLLATAAHGGDDAGINGMLARCYAGVGAYDQACEVKRLSLERDSSNVMDYYGLAGILLNAGRFDEAMTAINTYLDKTPDDGDGYSVRARIHDINDRTADAIDDYTTAIVLLEPDGDSLLERYNRALLYQAQGNEEAARNDWQHITATDSTSCLAALATMHLGNAEKARQLMEDRLNSNETPSKRRNTLTCAAQLQALLGNNAQAFHLLRQATACGHISPTTLRHTRDLATLQGEKDFEQIIETQSTPQIELSTTK